MRARHTDEFKADAVAMMHRGDRTLVQLAADLGVKPWNLRDWYKSQEMVKKKKAKRLESAPTSLVPPAETPAERVERLERENKRLRAKVEQLEEDQTILKKAAAFFARENK
jgi:transposase